MPFVDFVSLVIMSPAILYGSWILYLLVSSTLYLVFGRMNISDYKKLLKEFRLEDSFIANSKKFFWFTYTPLYAVVIMFRIVVPLDEEKYYGYMFLSIIGYIFVLLFSGYVFPKETKAKANFNKLCRQLNEIIENYEKAYPNNYLGTYYDYIHDFMNNYEKNNKQVYKQYNENTDYKKIAHILLLKIIYDFLISDKWKYYEHSKKCACNLFAYVARLSIKNNYIDEKTVAIYVTEIKKAK